MSLIAKQSMAQYKLLLLYLLNVNPKCPDQQAPNAEKDALALTELQMMRITDELGFMHYFDLKECLFELKESNHIYIETTPQAVLYSITPSGRHIINVLVNDLHLSSRNAISEYMAENYKELEKESQFVSEYLKLGENEYRVTLKVLEKNSAIFEINVVVYSKQQAKDICKKWKDNAVSVYKELMLQLS